VLEVSSKAEYMGDHLVDHFGEAMKKKNH
jgi:hypothetical protein